MKINSKKTENELLITIITVVFNGGATIEDSIKSVINLKYKNIEYIIIDGRSTDDTIDIIKKYDRHINYWISESDNGIYDAMNKGIKYATGDWIMFLGADDKIRNVLHLVAKFLKNKSYIYYGNVYWMCKKKIYDKKFSFYKLLKRNISHQAIFYPRTVFIHYSYSLKYKLLADYDLNLKLFNDKRFKFKYIDFIISDYNDEGSSANSKDSVFDDEKDKLIRSSFPVTIFLLYKIRKCFVSIIKDYLLKPIKRD